MINKRDKSDKIFVSSFVDLAFGDRLFKSGEDDYIRVDVLKTTIDLIDSRNIAPLVDAIHVLRLGKHSITRRCYDFGAPPDFGGPKGDTFEFVSLPPTFRKFLDTYFERRLVEFTLGRFELMDDEVVYTMAITHTDDNYNRQIGYYLAKLRCLLYFYRIFDHPLYNNKLVTLVEEIQEDE